VSSVESKGRAEMNGAIYSFSDWESQPISKITSYCVFLGPWLVLSEMIKESGINSLHELVVIRVCIAQETKNRNIIGCVK